MVHAHAQFLAVQTYSQTTVYNHLKASVDDDYEGGGDGVLSHRSNSRHFILMAIIVIAPDYCLPRKKGVRRPIKIRYGGTSRTEARANPTKKIIRTTKGRHKTQKTEKTE